LNRQPCGKLVSEVGSGMQRQAVHQLLRSRYVVMSFGDVDVTLTYRLSYTVICLFATKRGKNLLCEMLFNCCRIGNCIVRRLGPKSTCLQT